MTDDEKLTREFCGLMPHERITQDSYAGRVMTMLAQVRAETVERCESAWTEIDHDDDTTLPDAGRCVDFCVDRRNGPRFVCCGFYDAEKNDWIDPGDCDAAGDPNPYACGEVTHWRPRPELPALPPATE